MQTSITCQETRPRHQRPSKLQRFLFGVPYYPEHWTPEDMERDADRMQAAGVNVVRMGEFAWDLMEPQPGVHDFSLFDRIIARLGERDIDTILCTPTATPPRRLTERHPDWLRIDVDGRVMQHGSRQHCCTNHPGFRAESRNITRIMAEHFKENPRVIGWQTDNEFFCHISECYCRACEAGFQVWLEKKYLTIAALNHAWGTAFWAQTYDCFSQIQLPRTNRPTHPNPGQMLDYYRFLSDSLCVFQQIQIDVLRAIQPDRWITHNGTFQHYDFWKFSENLDFFAVDVYPGFEPSPVENFSWGSYKNEECRAASGSYIVPEQQGGAGGQSTYLLKTPDPGQMRLWAWQSVAHGADGILHFRWRTCRFGAEMYWNGILDHDNIPRRRYEEFSREGAEFKRIGPKLLGTTLLVRAAVLTQQDQDEAHDSMPQGLPSPRRQRADLYHELLRRHLPSGMVHAEDSLAGLDLILMPGFVLMDEALAEKLRHFVEQGGTLVAGARTATRDRHNRVIAHTPPGWLREVFGIRVEEFGTGEDLFFTTGDAASLPSNTRCSAYEIVKPGSAETLSFWSKHPDIAVHAAHGHPAVTLHRLGKGCAIYVGSYFTPNNIPFLIELILRTVSIAPLGTTAPTVEITARHSVDRRLTFVLNHHNAPQTATDLPAGVELISGAACTGGIALDPYGIAVIESPPAHIR